MSAHNYRITLEYLGGKHAAPETYAPLQFEAGNHDDLFSILRRVQSSGLADADEAAALALGMKLFGEVMLKHRKDPLFAALQSNFVEFINAFKQRIRDTSEGKAPALQ
ncbi:DUF3861 domain-containing protein [Oxalicibacterium faecigallinarum]|uniref:DUF3861 domain-containing protein n=1 Tax=Oxalicibacterium faecigallinarum TaxID=573741 RepID=A0A8J3ANA2_9BURK|nr:DUF3861 domain-containing protein [Oxalicibacterium faecigallinarum]GGI17862.1 hypothetical protein GCM10008066_11110 [Oxalicibacterium faecigallinarum]